MRDFDYLEPTRADEVCALLRSHGEDARLIAGGTALMLALRQRLVMPAALISLAKVASLREIVAHDTHLHIGAGCTHTAIATDAAVRAIVPTFAQLEGKLANAQVRNQGTLGGNLAYADPTTDPPGCLVAMGARAVVHGPSGERTLPMSAFLVDYFETALQPDEVLVAVQVPRPGAQARTTYLRHLRTPADHRPMANVSVHTDTGADGQPVCRVVVAAATPLPWSVPHADQLCDPQVRLRQLEDFAAQAAADMAPLSDTRCEPAYRRDVVRVLLTRALARHFSLEDGVTP